MNVDERRTTDDELAKAARFLIDAEEVPGRIAAGALLVDVRPDAERASDGLLDGAFIADRQDLGAFFGDAAPLRMLYADALRRPLILFCVSERGSSRVVLTLRELGFTDVTHVRGGLRAIRDVRGQGTRTNP